MVLAIEWPLFLVLACYLDTVLDTGHAVPRHPLFCLGRNFSERVADEDVEAAQVCAEACRDDVAAEKERVLAMVSGQKEPEAVVVQEIAKTFPASFGSAATPAVRSLSLAVPHGECFGMLGPNGAGEIAKMIPLLPALHGRHRPRCKHACMHACIHRHTHTLSLSLTHTHTGKTTTINMLIGFAQPTGGTASVEGLDVRTDMKKIYSLMGVCPQHDLLWDTLTAREHMAFYGRLKNLNGSHLDRDIVLCLGQVNLLHVIDEQARTFSGGMKRRLSVAIALIGCPLVQFLDEPSTGLDPASRRMLWRAIARAKLSRAVFLTTHSMEEAENLCDRLGIFVDGSLRCIGSPKELTARFGAFYVLSVTCHSGGEDRVAALVTSFTASARITYSLAGTLKFELPIGHVSLSHVFQTMTGTPHRQPHSKCLSLSL